MADAFFTRAPSTIVTIELTGQLEFTIPFEFLARKFVVVTLLGVDRKVLVMNTDYRFIAVNKIQLLQQPSGDYTRIELRRVTSATDRLVSFVDGSILRATDLNLAQVQTMHVAEEARDMTSDNIGVNDDGDLDARNRKIVNLAPAEFPTDAVNLAQLRQYDDSTANNADASAASASAALQSENKAKASENRSVAAETKAVSSAGVAATSAMDARTSLDRTTVLEASVVTLHGDVVVKHQEVIDVADKVDDAIIQMAGLGAVPVGTICMVGTTYIPVGWLRCGEPFDTTAYPALASLYPSGVTPSFDDRFARGRTRADEAQVGTQGGPSLLAHSHLVPAQNVTVTGSTSNFDYGTKSGNTSNAGHHAHGATVMDGWTEGGGDVSYYTGRFNATGGRGYVYVDSAGDHAHPFSVYLGPHTHSLSASGTVPARNTNDQANGSSRNDPHHTNVWFIIKAYEGVSDMDESLQVVGVMDQRVASLEALLAEEQEKRRLLGDYHEFELGPKYGGGDPWIISSNALRLIDLGGLMPSVPAGANYRDYGFNVSIEVEATDQDIWYHSYGFMVGTVLSSITNGNGPVVVPSSLNSHTTAKIGTVYFVPQFDSQGGLGYWELHFPSGQVDFWASKAAGQLGVRVRINSYLLKKQQ